MENEASRQEVLLFEEAPEGSAEALRLQLPKQLEEDQRTQVLSYELV